MMRNTVCALILLCILFSQRGNAAEFFVNGNVDTGFLSNTYLDDSREWDVTIQPSATLELDFQDIWAVGYSGSVDVFSRHSELFHHGHELYLILNPAFGKQSQHNLLLMPFVGTQKNTDTFDSVNLLYTGGELTLNAEPTDFLFWFTTATIEYRSFYNNSQNSSIDVWARTGLTFSLPSKTSIAPRVAFGYRHYPDPVVLAETPWDMQLKPGIRLAQGMGELSGIWLDYEYLYCVNDNNLVMGEMLNTEMNFTGTNFMFSGHGVSLGGKRIWENGWQASLSFSYTQRTYAGLEVFDEMGAPTGQGRSDDRVGGVGNIRYEREAGKNDQVLFGVGLVYEYLRQLSNDSFYDTDLHSATLQISLDI